MKRWLFLLLSFVLAACASPASATQTARSAYPDLGAAPELVGDTWINTPSALRLANLRGKVVLLDMWTFDCINCQHVIPSLRDWHEKYASAGLVVIGNHFPEFSRERSLDNLKQAVVDLKVPYAVVQDNDGINWQAYNNLYWPTLYLIDKQGHIRYVQIGEGNYAETESAIQALLDEPVL
jgi:thiol-disulfide isomerase/thioredoxin